MGKIFIIGFLVFWLNFSAPRVVEAQFGDYYEKFDSYVTDTYLKPFAKDLGVVLGGGSFHTARACGFPGFDVGGHITIVAKPGEENKIILDSLGKKMYGLPWVQAEVGLPLASFDLILRGFPLGKVGGTLFGTGVRYSLLSGAIPLTPAVSFSFLLNQLNHSKFRASNLSVNSVISVGLPALTPYLGFGIDSTSVESKIAGNTLEVTQSGWRLLGGVNLKLVPATYFHLGIGLFNKIAAYEFGLGINF